MSINRYALAVGNAERWTELSEVVKPSSTSEPPTSTLPQEEDTNQKNEGSSNDRNSRRRIVVQEPSQENALSREEENEESSMNQSNLSHSEQIEASSTLSNSKNNPDAPLTTNEGGRSAVIRTFKTAGNVVLFAAVGVGLLEITLLVLVLRI